MSYFNPYYDPFDKSASPAGPGTGFLKDFVVHELKTLSATIIAPPLVAAGSLTTTIEVNGVSDSMALDTSSNVTVKISIVAPAAAPLKPGKIHLVGFTYAMTPLISIGATQVDFGPTSPPKWTFTPLDTNLYPQHGPDAFFFYLFRPLVADPDLFPITVTLPISRAVTEPEEFAPSLTLKNFVMYELAEIDVNYRLLQTSALATTDQQWKPLNPGSLQQRMTTGLASELATIEVRIRKVSAIVPFEKVITGTTTLGMPDPNVPGTEKTPVTFLFPAEPTQPADGEVSTLRGSYALLPFLALLRFYQRDPLRTLFLSEALLLDAQSTPMAAITGAGGSDAPVPTEPATRFDWLVNPMQLYENKANYYLGGVDNIDVDPALRSFQHVGYTAINTDSAHAYTSALLTRIGKYGLRIGQIDFPWKQKFTGGAQPEFSLKGGGTTYASTKLTEQLDVLRWQEIGRLVAVLNKVLASERPRGPLYISTGEIGDTFGPLVFAVDDAKDVTQVFNNAIADHVLMPTLNPGLLALGIQTAVAVLRDYQLPYVDQQYAGGFREHLLRTLYVYEHWLEAPGAGILSGPVNEVTIAFRGLMSVHPDPDYALTNIHRYDNTAPGPHSGFYDGTWYNYKLPNGVSLSQRLPSERIHAITSIADSQLRNQRLVWWYESMRYYNLANIAYLNAARDTAHGAFGGYPVVHASNLGSVPLGYWFGYEDYNVVKHGALDCFWLDLSAFKLSALEPWHVLNVNIFAEYGAALLRVHDTLARAESPFRPVGRFGAFTHPERSDIRAIVAASRGATAFETFKASDHVLAPDGFFNSGMPSQELLSSDTTGIRCLKILDQVLAGKTRRPARVAILVPQSDSAWDATNQDIEGSQIFSNGGKFDGETMGIHALFVHSHFPTTFIFEEEVFENPRVLDDIACLYVSAHHLHDRTAKRLMDWVEQREHGPHILILSPKLWPPKLPTKEYREACVLSQHGLDRSGIWGAWLPPGNGTAETNYVTWTGKPGAVVKLLIPGDDLPGSQYNDKLNKCIHPRFMPDGVTYTKGISPTPSADTHRQNFIKMLDEVYSKIHPGHQISELQSAWVSKAGTNESPQLIETVDFSGLSPISAPAGTWTRLIMLFNYNHRHLDSYDPSNFANPDNWESPGVAKRKKSNNIELHITGVPKSKTGDSGDWRASLGATVTVLGWAKDTVHLKVEGLADYEFITGPSLSPLPRVDPS